MSTPAAAEARLILSDFGAATAEERNLLRRWLINEGGDLQEAAETSAPEPPGGQGELILRLTRENYGQLVRSVFAWVTRSRRRAVRPGSSITLKVGGEEFSLASDNENVARVDEVIAAVAAMLQPAR
ncbi:hypothetical protein BIV57_06320 [Mangrovactinospora gilvigrisea]|uniref:Uncharacterized protein n=1 Tax=Mangrovactinospora gilvigrisea TaxID=1428644 RepID=A0A1J7C9S6_9ACTN|nr:hypothetical protein [Mangrovactinospora gilvigrisea]OIV38280.1 hypothetical protein BIV57_06320 [Mangrovactinospora gilvigrisea]